MGLSHRALPVSGRGHGRVVLRLRGHPVAHRRVRPERLHAIDVYQQRTGRLRGRESCQRVHGPRRPDRPAPLLHGLRAGCGGGQLRRSAGRADLGLGGAAALPHRRLHGGRLPGGHEARGHLGARRHGAAGGHAGRRADSRLGLAAPVQCHGRPRLALHARRRFGLGPGGRGRHQPGRNRTQRPNRVPLPTRRRAPGLAHQDRPPGQFRLFGTHVGTLRDVGLDRRLPARELRTNPRPRSGADRGQAGHLRDGRHRRVGMSGRRGLRRPSRAVARPRSGSCTAARPGCLRSSAWSGAFRSWPTRHSSRPPSPNCPSPA